MITNIFEFYYTTEFCPPRIKPLSREELGAGMREDIVEEYLSLVEQLYGAFYCDVNAQFVPLTSEQHYQKWSNQNCIYNSIIKLLFQQNAISDRAYRELSNAMLIDYNFTEHPLFPQKYIGDSLDDFRLTFEYALVESDENIDLPNEYLYSRYKCSVCIRPDAKPTGIAKSSDLCVIRFDGTPPNRVHMCYSYWQVRHLLHSIQYDIESNAYNQKCLNEIICKAQSPNLSYLDSLQKTILGRPHNVAEWYTMKRAFEKEAQLLQYVEEEIRRIFEAMEKPSISDSFGNTLFIYKGKVLCHKHNHHLIPATAFIHDAFDREVELDVEYCPSCERYMLSYTSYEQYREQFGLLIGKLKMISSDNSGVEFDMAEESPLKLCGYNVSQTRGLTSGTRQYLLAKIIHDEIMPKLDVIHYLEHFIKMNGAKKENALALQKWKDDLEFVHKYNKNIQPKVYIDKIQPY